MQLFSYFLFFVVIWWVLFFIFLPIKNEISTEWQQGNANSAPTKSYLLIKVIITTILSFKDYNEDSHPIRISLPRSQTEASTVTALPY